MMPASQQTCFFFPARMLAAGLGAAMLLVVMPPAMAPQGVTTSGIRGNVSAGAQRFVDARVHVRHEATGFIAEVHAPAGRFLIQGLEPGGPYTVTVRSVGFVPERREGLVLALGELRDINLVLHAVAAPLDPITVAGSPDPSGVRGDGGIGTTIPATLLAQLPTLNRDMYDFVRLVPQISTKIGLPNPGLSAGGVGFRFNEFLINGVSERTLSGGVSNAFSGAKSVPIDAVQEYQVLHAPYDVRYGNFAGALVNAITKSGTNSFSGSVFAVGRNEHLARHAFAGIQPYDRVQYGLSLGGPIVRDRVHFFVAPELQRFTFPAAGPYLGQRVDADPPVPVSAADLQQFDAILRGYGLAAGSAGAVENRSPLRNLFSRVDLVIPVWNSRLVAWHNYSGSDDAALSRSARDTFSLASYQVTRGGRSNMTAAHLHTMLPRAGGGHNELLVSWRTQSLDAIGAVQQPIVRVAVTSPSGGRVTLNSGTHETAQSSGFRSSAFAIRDHLALPLGTRHVFTIGAELERFQVSRGRLDGSYGAWTFASLANLEQGIADRYEVRVDGGRSPPPISGAQYTVYAGDQWRPAERLSVTGGLRADLLAFDDHAPYHPVVDSLFGRRTDEMPGRRVEMAPRVGFVWDVPGTLRHRLRGGAGLFTGRYPLAWPHAALGAHGVGGVLRCTRARPDAQPPAFNPDHRAPPMSCLGGSGAPAADTGDVNLLDRRLRMMRVVRGSLAYDWRPLPTLSLSTEGVVTRPLSDFVMINLNLAEPTMTDLDGRVMYGTIATNGAASPVRQSPFTEVIDLRNTSAGGSNQLSMRLEHTRSSGSRTLTSYTYSRVRDVQTLLRVNTRGTAAWGIARATSGRHDDLTATISSNDIPHRVVAARTWVMSRPRWGTELSGYYVGESGRPFTYIARGTLGRGDLNADGSNINDPIYVPRSALDPLEIQISGFSDASGADNSPGAMAQRELQQRDALERFIERTSCLRNQRGRIVRRNSCREPWSNTLLASVRQSIPLAQRAVEVQLDVFNVPNLLNARWGLRRQAEPGLLEHVGQTVGAAPASRPVFRFGSGGGGWTTVPAESAFQLQLGARYRF